jgi:Putative peptidoglycan binding domain
VPFRVRRTAVLVAGTLVVLGIGLGPAAAATSRPVSFPRHPHGLAAPVKLPAEVEDLAPSQMQVSCDPVVQRGVRKLRHLALSTYGKGYDAGVVRSCVSGGDSEHKEGRAWDWGLSVSDASQRAAAGDFLAWLTANSGRQARRLGVMYVIYNRRIWSTYRIEDGWRAYTGSDPHTSHIHISLSWAGARGRTSFWTGRVSPVDYGPCAVFRGQMARLSDGPNPQPCPAPAETVRQSSRGAAMYGASGNQTVRDAQRRLGIAVTGSFDSTTWAAVKAYQRAHDLPVTGVLDNPTWASLAPESVTSSVTDGYTARQAAWYAYDNLSADALHRGSAGPAVAFLQVALRLPTADRNGLLARHTASAVRRFKIEHGLGRSAAVTARVWRLLARR